MNAKDIMVKDLITLKPTHGLAGASRLLAQHRIKGAPVVDGEGKMVGIVSKDDILAAVYREEDVRLSPDVERLFSSGFAPGEDTPSDLRVEDIMTRDVISASPDDAVEKICAIMVTRRIHRVPILDKSGKLAGLVSSSDILKAVANGQLPARA